MNQQDPLQQLWQSQPTSSIDIQAIKRRLRSLRFKQWGYALLDVLCLAFFAIVMWVARERFHTVIMVGLLLLLGGTAMMTGYLLWLRRHALFLQTLTTDQYIEKLKLQLMNNVRIAWLTKHSSWLMSVFVLIMWIGIGLLGDITGDDYSRRLTIVVVSLAVVMPLLWWWAAKREKKFKQELDALNQRLDNR